MAGLMVSCMGMEESDPSSLQVPEVKTFEVKDNGSLVFELTASVDKNLSGRIAECGFYYGKDKSMSGAEKVECKMLGGSFFAEITLCEYGETFYACSYISNGVEGNEICSDPKSVTVKELQDYVEFGQAAHVSYDRATKAASVSVSYEVEKGVDVTARGLCYGTSRELSVNGSTLNDKNLSSGSVTYEIPGVEAGKTYYVRPYLYDGEELAYGEPQELIILDLSLVGSANCYIVSKSGSYYFPTFKGNSNESVGAVKSVEVLWESFGTSTAPEVGDLIKSVSYSDCYITFQTADTFKEGNAVIAANDASGKILWSWHIWLTDEPGKCVYTNNAGTMMDRNLGATSANPGDVCALGLLYQWGRKDPFLGSSSINTSVEAMSSITWPSPVESSSSCGTISYAIEHPTTFICGSSDNTSDWYYYGSSRTDNTRWQSTKTKYDPCPAGWRVPDGGSSGVWANSGFDDQNYDSINKGILFGAGISSPATWYPTSGSRWYGSGEITSWGVGEEGNYWSVTPYEDLDYAFAYQLYIFETGGVSTTKWYHRAHGYSVRCIQE